MRRLPAPSVRSRARAAAAGSLAGLLLGGGLLASAVALADVPAGEMIDDAALADITVEGFEALPGLAPALLPERIDVATASDGDWYYGYKVEGMWIELEMGQTDIVPTPGMLDIDAEILVNVNDSADPFSLKVEFIGISSTCDAYVAQTPVYAMMDVYMQMDDPGDGTPPTLDVLVQNLEVDISELDGDQIVLDGCSLGTIVDVLDFFGLDVEGLIIDNLAGPMLEDQIAEIATDLETSIEDAFDALVISEEFDLEGVAATVDLYPKDVIIDHDGMRLQLAGAFDVAEASPCIAAWDEGKSVSVEGDQPVMREVPAGVTAGYHASIFLGDEFGNQALYGLWRGGLLCQTVDEELTGGLSLDTGILVNLAKGDTSEGPYDELFPESEPLTILTAPEAPPTLEYSGANDVNLAVRDLGLDFVAELDHRQARIVQVAIDMDAGVDMLLEPSTGAIELAMNISGDNITPTVTVNEFAPGSEADIEGGIGGLFDTLVGPLLDGLLGDLAIQLPSLYGMGIDSLEIAAGGDSEDWLGAYATIGEVPYESSGGFSGCGDGCGDSSSCSEGCGEDSGCTVDESGGCTLGDEGCDQWDESSSCSSGCGHAPAVSLSAKARGRIALLVLPLALALGRREDD